MKYEVKQFMPKGDTQGWLIALESGWQVPFEIKRVYYIYGTQPETRRGKHAHRALRQLAVCLKGSCRFYMNDGRDQQEILLNRNDRGLLIEPMVWHEMDEFSADCILLVLASGAYDESDYIRVYSEFAALIAASGNRS